jgi:hypothetical protein
MQRNCCSKELDALFLASHDGDKQIKDEIERNINTNLRVTKGKMREEIYL